MDYNTQRKQLVMPEYGRIVQEMVDHALTIEDRGERLSCAKAIVSVMANLCAQQRDTPDFMHKLWDQLAAMANYQLDIDYPYEITPRNSDARPPRVDYPMQSIRYRHYGHLLESLMDHLRDMPEGAERDQLVKLVANQMKRSLSAWNKDSMDGEKIAADLARYTDGKVQLDLNTFRFSTASTAGTQSAPSNGKVHMRSRRNKRN